MYTVLKIGKKFCRPYRMEVITTLQETKDDEAALFLSKTVSNHVYPVHHLSCEKTKNNSFSFSALESYRFQSWVWFWIRNISSLWILWPYTGWWCSDIGKQTCKVTFWGMLLTCGCDVTFTRSHSRKCHVNLSIYYAVLATDWTFKTRKLMPRLKVLWHTQ